LFFLFAGQVEELDDDEFEREWQALYGHEGKAIIAW